MRICVYGAGAIGGCIAVRLAQGGADVSVIARGAQLAAIRARGLTLRTHDATFHAQVKATDTPAELGPQDAVIVTVKAPALPSVAANIAPLLGPDTGVAFVMNGIPWWYFHAHGGALDGMRLDKIDPDEALWRTVTPQRAIGGVVYCACSVPEPGVIEIEGPNNLVVLGEPDGTVSPRATAIADALKAGGMGAEVAAKIRDRVWNKLMGNLTTGTIAVLTQSTVATIFETQATAEIARRIVGEGNAIATALGCDPGFEFEKRLVIFRRVHHKPSILQDLELGRPMEIDGLFGVPLDLARMVDVPTPVLDMLVALVKLRASGAGLYGG